MRTVLLGIQPSQGAPQTGVALDVGSRSGDFLARLLGGPATRYFETRNVLEDPLMHPRSSEALDVGKRVKDELAGRCVIMCGRDVAFLMHLTMANVPRLQFLEWFGVSCYPKPEMAAAIFPHPSGRNHYWNDADDREVAAEWLRLEAEESLRRAT